MNIEKYQTKIDMQIKLTSMALFLLMLTNSCMMMQHMPMDNMGANPQETALIDPVCGLEVNPESALTLEYEGKIYYFESDDCFNAFQKNPNQFAKQNMQMNSRNNRLGFSGVAIIGGLTMAVMMTIMLLVGNR